MVIQNIKHTKALASVNKFSGTASIANGAITLPSPPLSSTTGQNILIVVESPGKIKKIVASLPKDNKYRVLPSIGHFMELSKSGKDNLGINLDDSYEPNFALMREKKDVVEAIVNAAKTSDKILIATDPDREGELIGYTVVEQLLILDKPIKRIEFKEITKTGIENALKNERELDMNLVQAALSRRVLDRVVGFLSSPLVIKVLGKGLSAGRVQSVALRLLVDRELEIEAFKPEEYWTVQSVLKKQDSPLNITATLQGKISNKEEADQAKTDLQNGTYKVVNIESKQTEKAPPSPITTSLLQQFASTRFSFSGQRTMMSAQKLYEEGLITYHRTDSIRQSDEAITTIRDWISKNKKDYLPTVHNVYKNKDLTQDAHEAIRPAHLDHLPKEHPVTDEEKLYKLIWEATIGSQMSPAVYDMTTVTIRTDNGRELKATGKILNSLGWLSVTQYADMEKEDDKDVKLPKLNIGDELCKAQAGVTAKQKHTAPPKRYTEGSLIKELEKRGIGRPSTYADITNKITSREYVSKKGKSFVATPTGKKLVKFLCEHFPFMEYDYTSDMESVLDKIAHGEYSYVDMMRDFYPSFRKTIDEVYVQTNHGYKCKCGKLMVCKKSEFGHFLGCSDYPNCTHIKFCEIVDGKIVLSSVVDKSEPAPEDVKCPECNSNMKIRDGKFGKFYSCANYPKCRGIKKIPYGKKCPECGQELYMKIFDRPPRPGPVLVCMAYPECKHIEHLEKQG